MNNSMAMMEETRGQGTPATVEAQLGDIAEGIRQLAGICKSQQDMVQYLLGLSPGSHLENRSNTVQNDSLPEISERSFDIMAKEHRIRVVIGHDEEGNEIKVDRDQVYDAPTEGISEADIKAIVELAHNTLDK